MNVFSECATQALFSKDDILMIFDMLYVAHVEDLSCLFKYLDVCTYVYTIPMACILSLNEFTYLGGPCQYLFSQAGSSVNAFPQVWLITQSLRGFELITPSVFSTA